MGRSPPQGAPGGGFYKANAEVIGTDTTYSGDARVVFCDTSGTGDISITLTLASSIANPGRLVQVVAYLPADSEHIDVATEGSEQFVGHDGNTGGTHTVSNTMSTLFAFVGGNWRVNETVSPSS